MIFKNSRFFDIECSYYQLQNYYILQIIYHELIVCYISYLDEFDAVDQREYKRRHVPRVCKKVLQ